MSRLAVGSLEGLASEGYKISVASGSTFAQTGSVLQVVSTTKSDTFTMSSNSFADVTGLSVSITPKFSTSKVLVMVSFSFNGTSGTSQAFAQLVRDSTAIAIGDAAGSRQRLTFQTVVSTETMITEHMTFLDSPATTSATTYKMQIRSNVNGATVYVNRANTDTDTNQYGRGLSTITVMEIAG